MAKQLPPRRIAEWLATLRLVDAAETMLPLAAAGLGAVVLILGLRRSLLLVLLLLASHALVCVAVAWGAPRAWGWRWYSLIILSLAHLAAYTAMGLPGLRMLAAVYGAVAVLALALLAPALARQRRFFSRLPELSQQDDYRWAVTAAPQALRSELQRRVAAVLEHTPGPPDSRGPGA